MFFKIGPERKHIIFCPGLSYINNWVQFNLPFLKECLDSWLLSRHGGVSPSVTMLQIIITEAVLLKTTYFIMVDS